MFSIQFTTDRGNAIALRAELTSLGWEVFSQKNANETYTMSILLDTVHLAKYSQLENILKREAKALAISPISPVEFWKEVGA